MADFLKALLLKVSKNPWFLFWIVFPEVQLRRTMLVHTKIVKCIKEDLGKFAEIRGDYSFSIYAKFFEKIKFFTLPPPRPPPPALHIRNVSLSENFAYVLNGWSQDIFGTLLKIGDETIFAPLVYSEVTIKIAEPLQ